MNSHASTTAGKFGLTALAGLSLLGAVSGCSSSAEAQNGAAGSTASSPGASPASANFKDGNYSEIGHYDSPAGNASITVAVTLAAGIITDVKVTPNATNPTAKIYQGEFVHGIAAIVVGKKIDSINVSKMAGSSLTGTGFRDAIDKIKTDAAA